MKKVLIIGYFWPYNRWGSGRMLGLSKYLKDFGWEPIILTAPLQEKPPMNIRVIETNFPGDIFISLRKVLRLFGFNEKISMTEQIKESLGQGAQNSMIDFARTKYQEIFGFPDTEKSWRSHALRAAEELLENERIDALMSVWPVTSHLVAQAVHRKFALPWLADFPDPWSQSHNYPYSRIRKHFDEKLELRTIADADALTSSSPLVTQRQAVFLKRSLVTITNGFDPESISLTVPLADPFTITYTGTIYSGKQDPEKFLLALKKLLSLGKINSRQIRVRFYGKRYTWLDAMIVKHSLTEIVRQYGLVSREETLIKQRESHLLLLFNWEDAEENGVFPLKFFEYLAAQRPILAAGGFEHDYINHMLCETKAGIYAYDVNGIAEGVLRSYEEFIRTGTVAFNGEVTRIDQYSQKEMAHKFAVVLDSLMAKES
jgi:hypothetical protein